MSESILRPQAIKPSIEQTVNHDGYSNDNDGYGSPYYTSSNAHPIYSPNMTAAAQFLIAPHPLDHSIDLSSDHATSPSASSYSTHSIEQPTERSLSSSTDQPANQSTSQSSDPNSNRIRQLISTYSSSLIAQAVREKAYSDLSRIEEIFSSPAEQANLTKLQRWKLGLRQQRLRIMLNSMDQDDDEEDESNNQSNSQSSTGTYQLGYQFNGQLGYHLSNQSNNQSNDQSVPILPLAPPAFVRAYSDSDQAGVVTSDSNKRHAAFSFIQRSPSAPPETSYAHNSGTSDSNEFSDSASSISGGDEQSVNQSNSQSFGRSLSATRKRARDDISFRPAGLPPRPQPILSSKRRADATRFESARPNSRTTRATASLLINQPTRIDQLPSVHDEEHSSDHQVRSWEHSAHSSDDDSDGSEDDTDDETTLY